MTMEEKPPEHLGKKEKRIYWDWWRENPVEIVLVVLILTLFVFVPWQGCGVTEQEPEERVPAEDIEVIP